jgi:hypothetical protein
MTTGRNPPRPTRMSTSPTGAKHGYAIGTRLLAAVQFRLAKFLFDATSGIDALRTVEDDEEEQR